MGINSPLRGESIDPVIGVNYNRNVGLPLGADLALLVVNAGISVRTLSFSYPYLK